MAGAWDRRASACAACAGKVSLVCKATDESYNTQPEAPEPIWNLRGVLCNSWHQVQVDVDK